MKVLRTHHKTAVGAGRAQLKLAVENPIHANVQQLWALYFGLGGGQDCYLRTERTSVVAREDLYPLCAVCGTVLRDVINPTR